MPVGCRVRARSGYGPVVSRSTVAPLLLGCWRREWIRYADGSADDSSEVYWLQLGSSMADLRVPATHAALANRSGFDECSLDELRSLADSDSSTGTTWCSDVSIERRGVRTAKAERDSTGGIVFRIITKFPEPGLLEWNRAGDVLTERPPSGAYTEQWRSVPGTTGPTARLAFGDGHQVYRSGDAVMLVRDRRALAIVDVSLEQQIAACGDDRAALEALVDCEFSFALLRHGRAVIRASTLPWRVGQAVPIG